MSKIVKVKLSDIKAGPIVDRPLPEGFVVRVISFKDKLKEVETMTLEETLYNFQHDQNPERELKIWERIAENYEKCCKEIPDLSKDEKKLLFGKLLTG